MDELWTRIVENMTIRIEGPMKLRLFLQPLMASIFAIRSGLADAKAGKPPYFWSILNNSAERTAILKDGWKSVGKVFLLAVGLETVFQLAVLKGFYPLEAVFVAIVLAILPYLVLRGLANRLTR